MPSYLIIKPSSLGDIIHGLLVAESIRQQQPEAVIDWVVREVFKPIVDHCPTVRRSYRFGRRDGVSGFFRLMGQIQAERYDYVIDMQGLARSGLMTFFAKGRKKLGRSDAREFATLCYHKKAPMPSNSLHAVDILKEFLPLVGLEKEIRGALEFEDLSLSESLPQELIKGKPLLLFPNSRRAEKEWPYFRELTQQLIEDTAKDIAIVWVGQSPLAKPDNTDERFFDLIGQTSLMDTVMLIKHARQVVANDSGPMHISAAMDIPTLALFGPTEAKRYGPIGPSQERYRVISAPEGELRLLEVRTVSDAISSFL